MNYTTKSILLKLAEEREENAFISRKLLDETNAWIDRFKTFPEIEFELSGNTDLFLDFLENNKRAIEEALYVYFYAPENNLDIVSKFIGATPEEAEDIEGYVVIEDEDQDYGIQPIRAEVKKSPTITITFEELYNMISHMKNIVDDHTTHIALLQKQLNDSVLPKAITHIEPVINTMSPAPPLDNIADSSANRIIVAQPPPPVFKYDYPQDEQDIPAHMEEDETLEEPEMVEYDDNYEETTQTATTQSAKLKLTKGKKIVIVIVMGLAVAVLVTTMFMPVKKITKTDLEQFQPPSTVNAAIAPVPMKNISTVTLPPAEPVKPAYEPAKVKSDIKPVALEAVKPHENKLVSPAKQGFKYTENMKIYIKAGHDNIINLKKGEEVTDIQGQDTDNWNFSYKPDRITFNAKANKLKNTIIIKTSKMTYTLNLISSNKGTTLINLAENK